MRDILKCYVSGRHLQGEDEEGIVSFAVPDYGILFRGLACGSRADLEIIAMFSFLRFAEHNLEIFQKRELQIHTDFPILAFIMSNDAEGGPGVAAVREEARKIAEKIRFEVALIDAAANRAAGSITDIPAMPIGSSLKIKTFANLAIHKPSENSPDRPEI
jgi:hypothetical protein